MSVITADERKIIRELARQVRDVSQRPEMKQREDLWYAHNELKTTQPVIAVLPEMSWREIITPESLQCSCDEAREMEWFLYTDEEKTSSETITSVSSLSFSGDIVIMKRVI